jgi:hypothetical protein
MSKKERIDDITSILRQNNLACRGLNHTLCTDCFARIHGVSVRYYCFDR